MSTSSDQDGTGPRPRALLVDDEPDILMMVALELTDAGFDVVSVESGEVAVDAMQHSSFRIAVVDYRMTGMDGLETLAALRRLDPQLPVIISTGYVSQEFFDACHAQGAFECVVKPFNLDEIRDAALRAHASREL